MIRMWITDLLLLDEGLPFVQHRVLVDEQSFGQVLEFRICPVLCLSLAVIYRQVTVKCKQMFFVQISFKRLQGLGGGWSRYIKHNFYATPCISVEIMRIKRLLKRFLFAWKFYLSLALSYHWLSQKRRPIGVVIVRFIKKSITKGIPIISFKPSFTCNW